MWQNAAILVILQCSIALMVGEPACPLAPAGEPSLTAARWRA